MLKKIQSQHRANLSFSHNCAISNCRLENARSEKTIFLRCWNVEGKQKVYSFFHTSRFISKSSEKSFFKQNTNKTAGYLRYIFRLPIFVTKALKKIKLFFSQKKHTFFIIFSNFSHVQSFLSFCLKTSSLGQNWHFWEKYNLIGILQQIGHL